MFTGIIEEVGEVISLEKDQDNLILNLSCNFLDELKVDQSVAHNGVCLTVAAIQERHYQVVAIQETLRKSNLGALEVGSQINLERCMKMNARLDGHIVQGHVDEVAHCVAREDEQGSWKFTFKLAKPTRLIVEKGSITVNGISLTAFDITDDGFSVAIIPYTYEHTNFQQLKVGDAVNIEFDIIGKYVARLKA